MKTNKKNIPVIKKGAIIISILFIASFIAYLLYIRANTPTTQRATESSSTNNSINYNPPTEDEIQEGQDAKKRLISENEDDETSTNVVNVGIAFAEVVDDKLEIRAFIPSVIEGDGICTAILKKNEDTITSSSLSFIDSTTSQCRPIYISIDKFQTKGTWQLSVSYKSKTSNGQSSVVELEL